MIRTFYSYFRSSTAYRLRIALNLKKVHPLETQYINLREGQQRLPEYLAVNPMGAVPALVLEDGTVLTQSLAMLEWLEEKYPAPAILPQQPELKAIVRAFAMAISCDIHPLNNLRVLQYLSGKLTISDTDKTSWIHHWIHQSFAVLEQQIAPYAADFCFGDTPSLADICLVPQWYNAERFNVSLEGYPNLSHIVQQCRKLEAFAAAAPEKQPDFSL